MSRPDKSRVSTLGLVVRDQLRWEVAGVPQGPQRNVTVRTHFQHRDGSVVHVESQPGLRGQLQGFHREVPDNVT